MSMGVHVYKSCSCVGGWQVVAELRSAKPPLPRAEDDGFGRTLSFSRDGNTLAVGAWRDSGDASDNGTTVNRTKRRSAVTTACTVSDVPSERTTIIGI
jgi:hypothetical protein